MNEAFMLSLPPTKYGVGITLAGDYTALADLQETNPLRDGRNRVKIGVKRHVICIPDARLKLDIQMAHGTIQP